MYHRNRQFEAEQAELHQKLASLQTELTELKLQYDSLLEQVGQQHSLIQQLSGPQGTQNPGEQIIHMENQETLHIVGECEPKLLLIQINIFTFMFNNRVFPPIRSSRTD